VAAVSSHKLILFGGSQGPTTSTLQLLRTTLATLAASPADAHRSHLATSPQAVLDTTGHINFLAAVPQGAWADLLRCAHATLAALASPVAPLATMTRSLFPPASQPSVPFDTVLAVRVKRSAQTGTEALSADLPATATLAARAERLLAQALTDRAVHVAVWQPHAQHYALHSHAESFWLHVGLLLNSAEV
jgi:hypothetical protein